MLYTEKDESLALSLIDKCISFHGFCLLDINEKDPEGWTPLMNAAYHPFPSVLTKLLEAGADTEIANPANETAAFIAGSL